MRFPLQTLFALAAAVHVGTVANTALTARDSLGFARQALHLMHPERSQVGNRLDVIRTTQQPPGYPAAVAVAYAGLAHVWAAALPDQLLLAAQLVSAAAGTLIVFPFYRLAWMLLGPARAFAAGGVYQLLPAVARFTSDGLSESLFLLCCVTAVWLAAEGTVRRSGWWFPPAGLCCGLAYLVRPEGLLLGAALAVAFSGMAVARRLPAGFALRSVACLLCGTAVPAVPYMVCIGGVTNKPAALGLVESAAVSARPPLAEFAPTFGTKQRVGRTAWAARNAGIEFLRATHYAVGVLAALALLAFGRRLIAEPGWAFLLAWAGLHAGGAVAVAGYGNGYVSDRHVLALVPAAVLLAVKSLDALGRCWPWAAVALMACCVPSLLKPLHEGRAGHRFAGRYLAEALAPTDELADPFGWAAFHARRTVDGPKPVLGPAAIYAVLDDQTGEGAHGRLKTMNDAVQVGRDPRAELVYAWPPGSTAATAKVRVYRLATNYR